MYSVLETQENLLTHYILPARPNVLVLASSDKCTNVDILEGLCVCVSAR